MPWLYLKKMSDYISKCDLQFKLDIKSPSLKYAGQLFSKKVLFAIDIPYPVLKIWHGIVESTTGKEASTLSGSAWQIRKKYCDLLEHSIPDGVFAFRDCPEVRKEIDESLSKICGSLRSLYKKVFSIMVFIKF